MRGQLGFRGQLLEPEDAGGAGRLHVGGHGLPDDRGGVVEEALQGGQLRIGSHA